MRPGPTYMSICTIYDSALEVVPPGDPRIHCAENPLNSGTTGKHRIHLFHTIRAESGAKPGELRLLPPMPLRNSGEELKSRLMSVFFAEMIVAVIRGLLDLF